MGSANKNIHFLASLVIFSFGLLSSCVTQKTQIIVPDKSTVKFEPRKSLLNWYDVTHKSYYGLKGAVKRLQVKPVSLVGRSNQEVSDGWEMLFDKNGRLTKKTNVTSRPIFETRYSYSGRNELIFVKSYRDGKLWRSSSFIYQGDRLNKIEFSDNETNEQQIARVENQVIANGWFEIQTAVMSPGLPAYSQFTDDGALVWSNKGDVNNGLGELYYIRTVDNVTSSDVVHKGTERMQGIGGYRYIYNDGGLLESVESYNANNNRLFHRTKYDYNDLLLLISENKEVFDSSVFNEVANENAEYTYLQIDKQGNWTKRQLTVKAGLQTQKFLESREIVYY